jgi:hypothetical protein
MHAQPVELLRKSYGGADIKEEEEVVVIIDDISR